MVLEVAIRSCYAIKKSWLFVLTFALITTVFLLKFNEVKAQTFTNNNQMDCDANAVIWCGISSTEQLNNQFNSGNTHNSSASIDQIYGFFGITADSIANMNTSGNTTEMGWVSRSGKVYNNQNQLIATNAMTAGRQNITGSTREDINGTVFFVRPPSVSFKSQFLRAVIFTDNNQFKFAILTSCGNPVKAQAVQRPVQQSVPPTPPQQTPQNNICSGNTSDSTSGNCSINTTVTQTTNNPPPPPPAAPVAPTPQATPTTLVNTGINTLDIGLIFLTSSIIGAALFRGVISRKLDNTNL